MTERDNGAPPGGEDPGPPDAERPRRRRRRSALAPQTAAARRAAEGGTPLEPGRPPADAGRVDPRTGLDPGAADAWAAAPQEPAEDDSSAAERAADREERRRARAARVEARALARTDPAPPASETAGPHPLDAPGAAAPSASDVPETAEPHPPDADEAAPPDPGGPPVGLDDQDLELADEPFDDADGGLLAAEELDGDELWPEDPGDVVLAAEAGQPGPEPSGRGVKGVARNTAIFSVFTGLSRIAGLVREVVASSYFGNAGPASAFTIAFNFPNLIRSLFADAALSAAFVPVFTELLEHNKRREAFELASSLLLIMLAVLGAITALFILGAGLIMPLFIGDEFDPALVDLTIGLSRVLFPIVVLLGVNGLVVGILNAYGEFSMAAFAPLVWNAVIIAALVVLRPAFAGDDQLYAYAIGVLIGTLAQLALVIPSLSRIDFRFTTKVDLKDPRLRQVFVLMIPVTVGLGVINFDQYLNSTLGTLVSEQAPRSIDAAFRIYMLPQGMFSVAVATVLFPTLSRLAARRDLPGLRATMSTGLRQIFLLLTPAAVFTAVLATPIVRLLYQHGDFGPKATEAVSTALFWFSFSLPFAGANLLLTRTFFSLKQPWTPTKLAGANLLVNAIISLALYKPFGIAGLVVGTAVASFGMTLLQARALTALLEGSLEGARTFTALARIALACVLLGTIAYLVYTGLDAVVGRSLPGQVISVGGAGALAFAAYGAAVVALQVTEAQQIQRAVSRRLATRS